MPSTSVSHSLSHSTLVRAPREAASGERASARAEGISKAVQMQLNLQSGPQYLGPKGHNIGTEKALDEVIKGVVNMFIPSRAESPFKSRFSLLVFSSRVAPDREETAETTADVVLLTRAVVAHDPTLPNVWAFPSHPVPQAEKPDADADLDTNMNFNANENGSGQHQNDEAEAEDAEDNGCDQYDEDVAKVDLLWAKRYFTHVVPMCETKAEKSSGPWTVNPIACSRIGVARGADNRLNKWPSALELPALVSSTAATCVKERERLARFTSPRPPRRTCRASRFFTHVAAVSETKAAKKSRAKDVSFGRLSALLATPIREHAIGFTLQYNLLKVYVRLLAGYFRWGATTISDVELEKFVFRRLGECGRATLMYEISAGEGTSCKTRAMTITSRRLGPLVLGVFCTDYRTPRVPAQR
ncbi:BQ5605_C021g09232 [Microbotryum silenes-dioicae]|uniref:BQ5605_C021g09232 protein n=1 Tax=Microbotryum silenes-dioicae TaxID=796604 RepID=A0A2X0N5Y3_9BASI|nr:BQ5605_C021g09232 [Microbotryum silenes-dioicae]